MRRIISVIMLFLLNVSCISLYSSADYSLSDDTVVVVAHGFGGTGGKDKWFVKAISYAFGIFNDDSRHAPDFPDSGGYFSRTVLYTRPAVIVLIKQLNDLIQDGKKAIHLVAHSCGGGVVINMLAKLTDYENNQHYFENTGITLAHTKAIVAALKKGSINITAPLLGAERARFIIATGALLSGATCMAICAGLYGVTSGKLKAAIPSSIIKGGFVGLGLGMYQVLGKQLKEMYIKGGIRYIMPLVSRYNFDPYHPTPLESLEVLEDGLITRLQLCAYDEIIHFAPEDIAKLRLKAVDVQIVDGTGHDTISNNLCNTIIMNYCAKKMLRDG